MSRRGSTPFLQSSFRSSLDVSASESDAAEDWVQVQSERSDSGSWEDWRIDYRSLRASGFVRMRLSIVSDGPTGLEPYMPPSGAPVDHSLRFGVVVLSTESRQRTFVPGELVRDVDGRSLLGRAELDLRLEDLRGELKVEPMIVATAELQGPEGLAPVAPGTIVGTSHLIRLVEAEPTGPFGDMFDFQWVSFSQDPSLETGQLFNIDLLAPGPLPILYLNEDVENFHNLMNEPDNAMGRPSEKVKARRSLDTAIAVEVVTQCLSTIVQKITVLAAKGSAEDPEGFEFASVCDELGPHELMLAEGWRHLMGIRDDHEDGQSVCEEIARLSAGDVFEHLSSVMPRRVRAHLGMETAAEYIIAGSFKRAAAGEPE